MKAWLIMILKGMAVGAANIIPGVSGGTMAVVLGIYERLIEAIGRFFTNRQKRRAYLVFLAQIIGGAVLGVALLAGVMDYCLTCHEKLTMLFFMGLIFGSLPCVWKASRLAAPDARLMLFLAGGILLVLLLAGSPHQKETAEAAAPGLLRIFAAGAGAGGAMIIPGVSGSMILLILGVYHSVVRAVKDLTAGGAEFLANGFSTGMFGEFLAGNTDAVLLLGIMAAGAGAGVWVFAKLIETALRKAPGPAYAFILGLVGGSIIVLYRGFPPGAAGKFPGAALFLGGVFLSLRLGASGQENSSPDT